MSGAGERKEILKYYFSVEGETEQWYLEWLRDSINVSPANQRYKVSFNCKVQKDPLKYAKGLNIIEKTQVTHISDRESEDKNHVQQFETALKRMKEAEKMGKSIQYQLGYSNFTFDLWMILHKADCNRAFTNREQYLEPINRAYVEKFENMKQYKHEDNFKRILKKLSLDDVKHAVKRAKSIMEANKERGYELHNRGDKGYEYYKENPSLSVWEVIEQILNKCKLMQ